MQQIIVGTLVLGSTTELLTRYCPVHYESIVQLQYLPHFFNLFGVNGCSGKLN